MRTTFANTILKHAKKNPDIILLTADLGFRVLDEYQKALPKQFINMGVAEQNMISVAAGLAMIGKKVYCYSMVPFLVMRAFEQIRVDICNHNLGITLVGVGGGLSYGMEGMTHHAFEDIAIMRSLPGMTVVAPGDPVECEYIINSSIDYNGPLFIRLGKNNDPVVHKKRSGEIKIGKGMVIAEGNDICIIVTGTMLSVGVELIDKLKETDISSKLVGMHTIKPLDDELLGDVFQKYEAIFTIEEHSIIGGLGSAIAEYLVEAGYRGKFKRFGLPDKYCREMGSYDFLIKKSCLDAKSIAEKIISIVK